MSETGWVCTALTVAVVAVSLAAVRGCEGYEQRVAKCMEEAACAIVNGQIVKLPVRAREQGK